MARAHVMRISMLSRQLCQQPKGWEYLALCLDSESVGISYASKPSILQS